MSVREAPLQSFTAAATAGFDESPDQLAERAAAAERAQTVGLPTTEPEVWRYSRIDQLDLDRYRPVTGSPGAKSAPGEAYAAASVEVCVVDGWVVDIRGDADGVTVGPGDISGDLAAEAELDALALLTRAFGPPPLRIEVAAGTVVPGPLLIRHNLSGDGIAAFGRVEVILGEDAEATVIETYGEPGDGDLEAASSGPDALAVPRTRLSVARAGRLSYVGVQDLPRSVWQIAHQQATVAAQATLVSSTVALGGSYSRLRTDCRLDGQGAHGDLFAAYFADGDQMLDFRTFQDHAAPDTTSNLLYKGAIAGEGRSVYTGMIRVRPDGRGTNAFQTNRNIKLSEGAWAESVPNLEIENNEVQCSHASTVGPIDAEQQFYLESRGVPPAAASRLVVAGFFDEVLDLGEAGLSARLRERIGDKLDRTSELEAAPAGAPA